MAYFHCLIGGGSGGGYELTVTCDADFAGTTITCTDGVTTLTQTCPSASPYEVVFEIPNGGDWTISGVVGGQTVSTGVNIPTSASLIATVQQTVTIYSAKGDTISYTDIDGDTQTIAFDAGATSKQVSITINILGSSITFTSGVAKDLSDPSNYYSKTITIYTDTTEVDLMPDGNILYWYGYEKSSFTNYKNSTGGTVTKNTNNISIGHYTGSSPWSCTYTYTNITGYSKIKCVLSVSATTSSTQYLGYATSISNAQTRGSTGKVVNNINCSSSFNYQVSSCDIGYNASVYVGMFTDCYPNGQYIYAMWLE